MEGLGLRVWHLNLEGGAVQVGGCEWGGRRELASDEPRDGQTRDGPGETRACAQARARGGGGALHAGPADQQHAGRSGARCH